MYFNHVVGTKKAKYIFSHSRVLRQLTRGKTERRLGFLALSIATVAVSGCSDSPVSQPTITPVSKISPAAIPVNRQTTFSKLKFDDISIDGDVVHINGETDLPDSSFVIVKLDVPNRPDDAEAISVSKEATVSHGHFSASLTRPSRPEFLKQRCVVSLVFYPFPQSPEVQSIVGVSGEHLVGNAVNPMELKDPRLERNFEVSKTLPTNFHSDTHDELTGKINPRRYKIGTPERTLADFLVSWQKKDYRHMATTCQSTWLDGKQKPSDDLKGMFDTFDILGAKINGRDSEDLSANAVLRPGCYVQISATIKWAAGSDVQTHQLHVMVIRESGPYSPNPNGKWGVNPVSATGE